MMDMLQAETDLDSTRAMLLRQLLVAFVVALIGARIVLCDRNITDLSMKRALQQDLLCFLVSFVVLSWGSTFLFLLVLDMLVFPVALSNYLGSL